LSSSSATLSSPLCSDARFSGYIYIYVLQGVKSDDKVIRESTYIRLLSFFLRIFFFFLFTPSLQLTRYYYSCIIYISVSPNIYNIIYVSWVSIHHDRVILTRIRVHIRVNLWPATRILSCVVIIYRRTPPLKNSHSPLGFPPSICPAGERPHTEVLRIPIRIIISRYCTYRMIYLSYNNTLPQTIAYRTSSVHSLLDFVRYLHAFAL